MSNYGTMLLSRVLDDGTTQPLKKHHVEPSHFISEADRKAYDFILRYERENGQVPSYATVMTEVPDFFYVASVDDSFTYLTRKLKSESALSEFVDFVNTGGLDKIVNEHKANPSELFSEIKNVMESIDKRTSVRDNIGTDIAKDSASFLGEYKRRKEGESFKLWRSKFPRINDTIGGYYSGNMYTWYARSGRGKSVVTMTEAIEAARQGATVLVWAMEMSRFEWMARAYSMLSADRGYLVETIKGVDYEVGFENNAMLAGSMTEEFEKAFRIFLLELEEGRVLKGRIILRAADDKDFVNRSVSVLESDIVSTEADVVLVDPIYLMDFEANTSKTAGGDVANTSKLLRRMAGYTGTAIHVITQADEVKDDMDDDGNRELRAPKRAEIKKTKAVLEDAANVFGIDSLNDQAVIEIGKGRNGGEGVRVELIYLPNYGRVEQAVTEASASDFNF